MKRTQIFFLSLLILALMILPLGRATAQTQDFAAYVDPMVGTKNMGHTFPGATVPFGMVQLSPDTKQPPMYDAEGHYTGEAYRYCSGYQYEDTRIYGFSHTHFSGTGHSDLGDVSLMPTVGPLTLEPEDGEQGKGFYSAFSHDTETAEPGYYGVTLDDYGVQVDLTATTRVGLHRYSVPEDDTLHVLLDMVANIYQYDGKNVWTFLRVENDTLVTGYRQSTGWARTRTVYFAMAFSQPIANYGHKKYDHSPYGGFWRRFNEEKNFPEMAGRNLRAYFDFAVEADKPLGVKVALSNVSTAGAVKNMQAEVPGWDFEDVKAEARKTWNKELGRVDMIGPSLDHHKVFYTALYHTMLGPIVYEDVDGQYRGLDQNVHSSEGFTNYTIFSLWDTYRALHPLFTVLQPSRNADMVNSMLAHYDESVHGMLPIWSHYANENWCMIGYHSVSAVVDALVKGGPGVEGIDAARALEACVATSKVPYFDGVGEYTWRGYVPDEVSGNSVSITLELAYDDWCIAQLAQKQGDGALHKEYMRRAGAYKNVYDPKIGFMRPRQRDGLWREEFNTMETHGQGFIEGNAWNYSLYVPHAVPKMVEMMGGPKQFSRHLDELFEMELGDEFIAHTEDITRDGIIGNYVHGNEPGHHIAYLYNWTDRPWMTQKRVRMIMDTMYGTGVDGLCGNDDAGQMSAWYIFSALGFYPVAPGSDKYAIGSPLVNEAVLNLENGNTLRIVAKNQGAENVYVQGVTVNGAPLKRRYLTHAELMAGGEIVFTLGPKPNRRF